MPLFDYQCTDCDEIFDELVKPSQRDKLPNCPKCGSHKCRKLISTSTSFQLKGGGWYADGYAQSPKGE